MGYFPFFMNIEGRAGLIAGGGRVALRKIQKLLPFGPVLTVEAPEICAEIRAIPGLRLLEREFRPGDEQSMAFVIAATDSRETNRLISERCKRASIPVNTVDDEELCSFIFPALVMRGRLTVGISTGGSSPTAARCLKEKIDSELPERFDEILDYLHEERIKIKAAVNSEPGRRRTLEALYYACMEKGRPLNPAETGIIFKKLGEISK